MEDISLNKINVVILAGGKGCRLYPLTKDKPKPLVEVGNIPVIEHIVRYFAYFGIKNIKILVGHKGDIIKKYFRHSLKETDVAVECINTGEESDTAERLWQTRNEMSERFILSYSDVLHNINLIDEIKLHIDKRKIGTMGVVPLRTPYGILKVDDNNIAVNYLEKPILYDYWMNCGLFVFEKTVFDYWDWKDKDFSKGMLVKLAQISQLAGYKHNGFWSGMDTVRENEILNELWDKNEAEWAIWK